MFLRSYIAMRWWDVNLEKYLPRKIAKPMTHRRQENMDVYPRHPYRSEM